MRTVLVTGASGFVGRHACAELAAHGWRVRGLVRGDPGRLPPGVEPAPVRDLTDREGLARAVAEADAVVHLAARVHVMHDTAADPLAEFRRVNVQGTRALLDAAERAGVRAFVFVSSVKAVGEESGGAPWPPDVEPHPVDPYGVSKLEAERLVRARAADAGMHAPVLRFPLVYGPGVGANMAALVRAVDRGVPLPFGRIRNARSLLYAGNAAAAIRAVLDAPAVGGLPLFVSDGRDLSTPELVRQIARALGRPARLLPVPPSLFRAAGRVGDLVGRVRPVPLSTAAVRRLLGSLAVDASELRRLTGEAPPFTVEEGMAATVAAYRQARG